MNKTKTPSIPAGAVTAQYDFFHSTHGGSKLFSVCAGVPLGDAFDQLTVLLAAAKGSVEVLALTSGDTSTPDAHWATVHMLSFATALAQSINAGHNAHARGEA